MRVDRFKLAAGVLLALGSLLTAISVQSIPRYSARYGQTCNLCHVNPA